MQRGFAQLLLIAIFAAAILSAAAAYFFIFKNQPQPNVIQDKQSLTSGDDKMVPPLPPNESSPKPAQTFRHSLGFEFTVPEGFTVKEETEAEFHKRSNGDMRKNFNYYVQYEPASFAASLYVLDKDQNFDKAPLSLWVFDNPNNLDAAAFYKRYWYYPFIWGDYTYAREKIAPLKDIMISESTGSGAVADFQTDSPKYIYLPKEGKMYLFKIIGDNKQSFSSNKILDSFKFTD